MRLSLLDKAHELLQARRRVCDKIHKVKTFPTHFTARFDGEQITDEKIVQAMYDSYVRMLEATHTAIDRELTAIGVDLRS